MFELSGFSLIGLQTFASRHRTLVNEVGSIFENSTDNTITYIPFNVTNAIWCPATKETLDVLPEGMREEFVVELYTDTYVTTAVEGTNNKGDQISIDVGKGLQWFSVKSVQPFVTSGFLNNYKVILVRELE